MEVGAAFMTGEAKITGGEITTITSPRYPLQSPPFFLVVEVLLLPAEQGVTHYLEIEFLAPDGQVAGKTPRESFLVGNEDAGEYWHISHSGGVLFPAPGAYSLVVFINGVEYKRVSIQAELP